MVTFHILEEDFEFYKTSGLSLTSIVIISWFVYALFSENYIGHQFFNNLGYIFVPVLRPDFIIYLAVVPIMTTFWNIIFQSRYRIKYVVKSYPIMYMMTPFFLDNFYFLLNHVPPESFIEIQFVFISNPTVFTYQLLTVFYLLMGFIVLFWASEIWHVLLAMAFAIGEFSSLLIAPILESQIMGTVILIYSTKPIIGFLLGNQLKNWYISFERNSGLYLTVYFMLVLIVSIMMVYFKYKLGSNWWQKRPIDVSSSKLIRFIKIVEVPMPEERNYKIFQKEKGKTSKK